MNEKPNRSINFNWVFAGVPFLVALMVLAPYGGTWLTILADIILISFFIGVVVASDKGSLENREWF